MRNTINTRTNVVVFGNGQGRVVVAGTDRLRALGEAHLLVSRQSASTAGLLPDSGPACAGKPKAKPTAAMRRAACATRAAACYAGEQCAGIPARQRWHRSHRLPRAAESRG